MTVLCSPALALALALAVVPAGADVSPSTCTGVALASHRGEVGTIDGAPVLRYSVRVLNHLRVAVAALDFGVLFAATAADLAAANPARLYAAGAAARGAVGVGRQRVLVTLPAGAEADVVVTVRLDAERPAPVAFYADLLGYELAVADGALLLELLGTATPCDEAAAVDALALRADRADRAKARARWHADPSLVAMLAAEVTLPVPRRPRDLETFRRVYAVRALGVLGGKAAAKALGALAADPDLDHFDEPLQVLRVARAHGSPIETPLALALPEAVERMSELVALARADLTDLSSGPR